MKLWADSTLAARGLVVLTPARPTGGRLGAGAEHCVAISGVGAERATALRGGRELGGLPVVELGAGVVGAVAERRAGAVEGIPRVGCSTGRRSWGSIG